MPFPTTILSAEVRALTDCFLATPIGGVVTYPEMTEAIGADIMARRYLVMRAIKTALRENGAIFGAVTRVGYQRLSAEQAHTIGSNARARVRRTSRRAADAITRAIAVANDVSDEARGRAFAEISALQLIQHLTTDKARSVVVETAKPQPVAVTLRAMMTQIGAVQEAPKAA